MQDVLLQQSFQAIDVAQPGRIAAKLQFPGSTVNIIIDTLRPAWLEL